MGKTARRQYGNTPRRSRCDRWYGVAQTVEPRVVGFEPHLRKPLHARSRMDDARAVVCGGGTVRKF